MKQIGSQKIMATYVYWFELDYEDHRQDEVVVLCNGVKDDSSYYDHRDLIVEQLPDVDLLEEVTATGSLFTVDLPNTLATLKSKALTALELEADFEAEWFYWDGAELYTAQSPSA